MTGSIDTVGVHYSATIWRWYRNWIGNGDTIKAKYGERWFRVSRFTPYNLGSVKQLTVNRSGSFFSPGLSLHLARAALLVFKYWL